jgi:hypothetical protein
MQEYSQSIAPVAKPDDLKGRWINGVIYTSDTMPFTRRIRAVKRLVEMLYSFDMGMHVSSKPHSMQHL